MASRRPSTRRLRPLLSHLRGSPAAADADGGGAVAVEAEASVAQMADAHLIQPYDELDNANPTHMVQAGGEGIYLITDKGEQIIDGAGGARPRGACEGPFAFPTADRFRGALLYRARDARDGSQRRCAARAMQGCGT